MRGKIFWSACFVLAMAGLPGHLCAADLTERRPTAASWLVVDAQTGVELRYNRTHEFRPIASTTKLLTALAVIRDGSLDQWVRVSATAAAQPPSKMGLQDGEQWRRRDLLYALLMQSSNDVATTLAESVSGSEDAFCRHLTALAKNLGCGQTRIRRASGLPRAGQGATASDLERIAAKALADPLIKQVCETDKKTIRSRKGRRVILVNKNRLHDDDIPVLGKTGYTRRAQRCFAGEMSIGGRPYRIVLLGSKNLWGDLKLLREWTKIFTAAQAANARDLTPQQTVKWQQRLAAEGFDPGPADGLWGPRTQMAYLRWQQHRGETLDGRVS